MKKFLSACLLLMMVVTTVIPTMTASAATGTTYYVDSSSGNDSNIGTNPSSAWQTLSKVNSTTFQPGDQILFKAGGSWTGTLHPLGSGDSTGQITIDMYDTGSKPLIAGNGASQAVLLDGQEYWTINNLEITNTAASRAVRSGITILAKPTGITHGIHITNNNIHDVTGENRRGLPGGQNMYDNSGIHVRYVGTASSANKFDDVLIQGNNIHDVLTSGIKVDESQGGTNDQVYTNVVVRNNIVNKTGSDGIILGSTFNVLAEYNAIYDSGYYGNAPDTQIIAGLWENLTKNATFQYNEVARTKLFNNDGTAFDTDFATGGTVYFQYNYTHGNEGGFWLDCANIFYDSSYVKTVLRYNVSVDDLGSITRNGSKPAEIYNNTFYKSSGSLNATLNNAAGAPYKFWNNIFNFQTTPNWASSQYSNNLYYPIAANPADGNAVTGDPKFVNPGAIGDGMSFADNYKLQATSVAIDAGKPIIDNGGKDLWGNSLYNVMPDIGAHEYGTNGKYDANTTNKLSLDFSSTQGQKNWYYMQASGGTYSNMTWNSSTWKGTYNFNLIWSPGVVHPDINDSVIGWKAPKTGQVRITGKPRKDNTGGDGVNVKIMQNGSQIWPASGWQYIGASDMNGVAHDVIVNATAGDMIYFVVNRNGNNNSDATFWDPMVRYASTLSNDFSSTQGSGYWYYMQSSGGTYSNMTWVPSRNAWQGSYAYNLIWNPSQIHPDVNDSVVAWKAPVAGTVRITGNPKKGNSGGDGVNVKIMKNGTQIWPASGWQYIGGTDTTGVNHDVSVSVVANDTIYFVVNKNGNINSDETSWNPTVAYQ